MNKPDEHDCSADGEQGCEVCREWWADEQERWEELKADEERASRHEVS